MKLHYSVSLVIFLCAACRPAPTPQPKAIEFAAADGVLYRVDQGKRTAVLALDSAHATAGVPVAPPTWTPQPGSTFGTAAKVFRHVAGSPNGDFVAWETNGAVHDLLGISPGRGGKFTVLDFYFDSSADSLKWEPAGRMLTAYYMPPSGIPEARVYDAVLGKRIK